MELGGVMPRDQPAIDAVTGRIAEAREEKRQFVIATMWRGLGVRFGIKCTVFFLLLLTIYLFCYFYYTLVRVSL